MRRKAAGFGIIAGMLALASVAYACLPFYGKITISGNFDGYVATQSIEGSTAFAGWCGGTPAGGWTVRVAKNTSANVHASVSPATGCPSQLADAVTWELRSVKGEMINGNNLVSACYVDGSTPPGTTLLAGPVATVLGSASMNATNNFNASKAGKFGICFSRPKGIDSLPYTAIAINVYSL